MGSDDRHANNFNLMRMVAATMVLLSHCFALLALPEPLHAALKVTPASIAVDMFFVTSGYLVVDSLMRRGSVRAFLAARALRVYPALIVAVLLVTAVCSAWFSTLSAGEFWSHRGTWSYLVRNITLAHPTGLSWTLPETLMSVPTATPPQRGGAINGSLWSVYDEVRMYLGLALLFVAVRTVQRRWRRTRPVVPSFARVLLVVATVMFLLDLALSFNAAREPDPLHRITMFAVGAALRGTAIRSWLRPWPAGLALALLLLAAAVARPIFLPLYTLTLPYLVLAAAYLPGGVLRGYNRVGDYSYGMYIYAFPVQQWTVSLWPGVTPWQVAAVAFPLTLALAMLSWHLLEKHMLALKSRWQPRPSSPIVAQHA